MPSKLPLGCDESAMIAPASRSTSPIETRSAHDFTHTYSPPAAAHRARHILVKPNLGYPEPHPVTVSPFVLHQVLQGLRRVAPEAEITIVEGVCSAVSLREIVNIHGIRDRLDAGMHILDADTLPMVEYPNRSPHPVRFKTMIAPAILQAVDCRISVGTLKRTHLKGEPLISASLKNLYGLFPRAHYKARSPNSRGQLHRPSVPAVLQDVYGCIGHLFDGAIVDATQKYFSQDWKPNKGTAINCDRVIWGEDLIAVDRHACLTCDEPIPAYLAAIEQQRSQWSDLPPQR
jgi:Domain of unknown function (DUF362)